MDPEIEELIGALRCLPGVGLKSARRMALHLLERERGGAIRLARSLHTAIERVGHCQVCRTLTTRNICSVCADPQRDQSVLCIVETPGDVLAILNATDFPGMFHVLLGLLSPLDGMGPKQLGLDALEERLQPSSIHELILALSGSVEGEVTAHYLSEMAVRKGIRVTRIARGVPAGGELEYLDQGTLHHAFSGRRDVN